MPTIRTARIAFALLVLGVVASAFLLRFQPVVDALYERRTLDVELLARVTRYDHWRCYAENLSGTYCTREVNSIGGMLILAPIFALPKAAAVLVHQGVLIALAAAAVIVAGILTRSLVGVLLAFLYLPFFSYVDDITVAPSSLLLAGSILAFARGRTALAHACIVPLALFRPEAAVVLLAYAWVGPQRANALTALAVFVALFLGSMGAVYGDPLAQWTFNVDHRVTPTTAARLVNGVFLLLAYAVAIGWWRRRGDPVGRAFALASFGFALAYTYFAVVRSIAFDCCFTRHFAVTVFPFLCYGMRDVVRRYSS